VRLGCHPFRMQRLLASVFIVGLLAGCGSGSDEEAVGSTIEIPMGFAGVESAGPPVELPDGIQEIVVDAVDAYVRDGIVATLRTGEPERLDDVFDTAALASLETESGAALLDRGVPEATGDLTAVAEPVIVVGLADGAGVIVLVSAHVDLEVVATTDEGELRITRVGDLTFAPAGDTWRITAFSMLVARDGAGIEETAEAVAP